MKQIILASLILISAFAVREQVNLPEPWTVSGGVDGSKTLTLQIFVKQQNLDVLEQTLYAVSDPKSPSYGQHLTNEEITEIVEPKQESLNAVYEWLIDNGIEDFELNANKDIIKAEVSVSTVEAMLNTKYSKYQHENGLEVVRCLEYSVPAEVEDHIDFVGPTVRFPLDMGPKIQAETNGLVVTPKEIRKLYNIGDAKSTAAGNSIGLTGFLNQYYSKGDLGEFATLYDSEISSRTVTVVGKNGAMPGVEADLDMQYGMAIGAGVEKNYFWSTTGDQPNNTGSEPFLVWMYDVSNATDVPNIFSISYGDNEDTVNFEYGTRVGVEFQKAGVRGISLLSASGDGGVAGGQPSSCKVFIPTFPAALPYITAVGGTSASTPEKAAGLSSGGFSNYWDAPDYQKSFISTYKKTAASSLPDASLWNQTGSGFPDVAAQAENYMVSYMRMPLPVAGTSCASPTFSGMVALLNSIRLEAGKSPLGWLNPLIYQNPQMFNDITSGNNPGCGTNGFSAVKGWDPVTGLGSLQFDVASKVVSDLN